MMWCITPCAHVKERGTARVMFYMRLWGKMVEMRESEGELIEKQSLEVRCALGGSMTMRREQLLIVNSENLSGRARAQKIGPYRAPL